MAYNRYSSFNINGRNSNVPFIKITKKNSDKEEVYKLGFTRLDLLSEKYYKNPNYGWLILLANPEFEGLEFKIKDNETIIIPYPLEITLKEYKEKIDKYIKYYGL